MGEGGGGRGREGEGGGESEWGREMGQFSINFMYIVPATWKTVELNCSKMCMIKAIHIRIRTYCICSNRCRSYNYFQVQRDVVSIWGWLTFEGSAENMASQVDEAFCFDSIVRGHHVYNRVWTLFLGRILTATMAAAIPSPLRRVFALAAVVAEPLSIICKCGIYLKAADYTQLPQKYS